MASLTDRSRAEANNLSSQWLGGLLVAAAVVRLMYFTYARGVHGDAVQFAEIARSIGEGNGLQIDSSWYQAFCLYQVPFQWLISDPVWAAALSSMIPGVLLVWPVAAMADRLFGRAAAVVAGAITALHPHLVNYSCNGYMESFYLFWFSVATLMLTRLMRAPRMQYTIVGGTASGIAFATRNEFLAFLLMSSGVLLATIPGFVRNFLDRWTKDGEPRCPLRELPAVRVLALVLCFNLSATIITGMYAGISKRLTGSYGMFEKTGNFGRTKDIFNQRAASALEIYGSSGQMAAAEETKVTPIVFVQTIAERFFNNITEGMIHAVPNLLASPVYVFAGVLFLGWLRRPRIRMEVLPIVMMLGFAPALFSLFFVQPRYLQPMLPALNVFTGAGYVMALGGLSNLKSRVLAPVIMRVGLVGCVLMLAATTGWRATVARAQTVVHEKVASWVDAHIDDSELLVGCGFGCISNTAFLSGNKSIPRVVTDVPEELATFVRKRDARWLLLYEPFIQEANPGLAPLLDFGVPGFTKEFEATDASGKRVQVYRLSQASIVATGCSGDR